MNDEKDEKLNENVAIAVVTPLSLRFKCLITNDIARALAYKSAMSLGAVKTVTATITAVLKNN